MTLSILFLLPTFSPFVLPLLAYVLGTTWLLTVARDEKVL